jgi:hypothetical protein
MQPSTAPQPLVRELVRVDLLLQIHLWRARQAHAAGDPHRGLYISDAEVGDVLERRLGAPHWCAAPEPPPQLLDALRDCPEPGPRLKQLTDTFRLSPFERDALLITLAPEVDLRYERVFGYLADDITRRRPTVEVILNLLSPTFETKLAARASFSPEAPLIKHGLLHLFADSSRVQPPLLDKLARVDERVIAFLLEDDAPAPPAALSIDDLLLPRHQVEQLENAIRAQHAVVYLRGSQGSGRRSIAEACCAAIGLRLFAVDGEAALKPEPDAFERAVCAAFRETLLTPSAILWSNFDAFLADSRRLERQLLFEAIAQCGAPVFLSGEADWQPPASLLNGPFVRIDLACPSAEDRAKLWTRFLGNAAAEPDLADVAARFRLNPGQIRDAAASAINVARSRGSTPSQADLYAACRAHSNSRLGTLARKLEPRPRWDDIVLPPDRKQQLLDICNWARYRALVYEDWGFDRKLSLGKGLNVLFAGPPGTGKTMAAEILAGELGLDLYKIDLSSVVSKYIGETEKNLSRIFAEAETSNAVLFFDEADALFGKRTEVRDAHDRYANIETGYLLQRMEEYEGIAILATNLKKNLDEAFVRRMQFMLEFPLPSELDRRHIWKRIWPEGAPLAAELDLDLVAARFQITGGNIRNVALGAAFLAASDGKVIAMSHLWQAMRREYQKMGKVLMDSELETLVNA